MPKTTMAERVVRVETRLEDLLETQLPDFRRSVEKGFADLGEQVAAISPNGQTPRLIAMGKRLGDPDSVEALAQMVEARKRWRWLLAPFTQAGGSLLNALSYIAAGVFIAWLGAWAHSILHAALPSFIP
jgi:hypothetical protein